MDCADILREIFSWLGDDLYNVRRVNKLFRQVADQKISGAMPASIIFKILSYLEVEQLYVVRRVNRHFKKLADRIMLCKMSFHYYVDGVKHTNPDILYSDSKIQYVLSKFEGTHIYFADATVRITDAASCTVFECAGLIYAMGISHNLKSPAICLRTLHDGICDGTDCCISDVKRVLPNVALGLMATYLRYFLRYIHPLMPRNGRPLKVPYNCDDYEFPPDYVRGVYLRELYYNPKIMVLGPECIRDRPT
jgi:hypothetical protein